MDNLSAFTEALGIAGTISTTIGLVALVAILAYFTAVALFKKDNTALEKAIETGDAEKVRYLVDRYEIPKEIDNSHKFELVRSYNQQKFWRDITRYFLLFFLSVAILIASVAIIILNDGSTEDKAGADRCPHGTSVSLVSLLCGYNVPSRRLEIFRKAESACNRVPNPLALDFLAECSIAVASPPEEIEDTIARIESAQNPAEVRGVIEDLPATPCGDGALDLAVRDGRLVCANGDPIPFYDSPNQSTDLITPKLIILGWTGGNAAEQTIRWYANPRANASQHAIINRDGAIAQLVLFDRKAWHAGRGTYGSLTDLNNYSIGIGLANLGLFRETLVPGEYLTSYGARFTERERLICTSDNETIERFASLEALPLNSCFELFPEEQIDTIIAVISAIYESFGPICVVPSYATQKNKISPGPALPLDEIRDRLREHYDEPNCSV